MLCKECGGIQDQIAASYGGLNKITFTGDGYSVNPIIMPTKRKRELNENLMLFFTGFSRYSSEIAINQKNNISSKKALLNNYKYHPQNLIQKYSQHYLIYLM